MVGGQYRWAVDTNNDGVPDLVVNDPANINGQPVAGNFDGNAANGDEVGLFTGTHWYLDTNHDYMVDTVVNSPSRGYPIVGDFDGDGIVDLATYQPNPVNKFFFDFGANGYGQIDATIDAASQFGFIGVRSRPVAADMDARRHDRHRPLGAGPRRRLERQPRRMVLPAIQFRHADCGYRQDAEPSVLADPGGPRSLRPLRQPIRHADRRQLRPPGRRRLQGPTISQVAIAQVRGRMSWNVSDPDGVAGSTLAIDGAAVSGITGPFSRDIRRELLRPLGLVDARQPQLHDHRNRQGRTHLHLQLDLRHHRQGPTISLVTVSQSRGRISWNALDPGGVAMRDVDDRR